MIDYDSAERNYDASGYQLTNQEIDSLLTVIEQADYLDSWQQAARAITVADTDALFVPSDTFHQSNDNGQESDHKQQKNLPDNNGWLFPWQIPYPLPVTH